MTYTAPSIANTFIDIAGRSGELLTNMKLQKLLFFAQGWYLAFHDRRLFDEQIEAWSYGPVVRSVYHKFSHNGAQPIAAKAIEYVSSENGVHAQEIASVDDPSVVGFLEAIWRTFGGYTATQLSQLTHSTGTPWSTVAAQYDGSIPKSTDIPEDLIKRYFKEKRQQNQAH